MFNIFKFIVLLGRGRKIMSLPMPWDDTPQSEVGTVTITDISIQLKPIEFLIGQLNETGTIEITDISISMTAT